MDRAIFLWIIGSFDNFLISFRSSFDNSIMSSVLSSGSIRFTSIKVLNKVLLMFFIDWAITDLKIPIIFTLSPGFTKSTKSCFKIA